jgi:nitrogen regulatory protein PII
MLNMQMLIVITDRSKSKDFIDIFHTHELPLTLAMYGQGTATKEILDMFSLGATEKSVLICVAIENRINSAVRAINHNIGIKSPGTSVVFTIPLNSISGKGVARFLSSNQTVERKEYAMSLEEGFELIIVILNEGYSSFVMDAARTKGGATGGTVLHARGTGMAQAQKFLGISISEEKEMILIVCRTSCRNRIMQAIMDDAGQSSEARSIVFSLPISSVGGLWILNEEERINEK